jgi:hypothetical protein
LNWDDESLQRPTLDPVMSTVFHAHDQWQDSWLSTNRKTTKRKQVQGYTYDHIINPMLRGRWRKRYDRCLVRSSRNNCPVLGRLEARTLETVLLGQEAIQALVWDKENTNDGSIRETPTAPSDHFGLVATLRLSESSSLLSPEK